MLLGKHFVIAEIFLKDLKFAQLVAKEIEALKTYVITSPYNARLGMYLNHQFQQKSLHKALNSLLR